MELTLSRDQAALLSRAVYVCGIALFISAAIYFQSPGALGAVLVIFVPLLPAVWRSFWRFLNPTLLPRPRQGPEVWPPATIDFGSSNLPDPPNSKRASPKVVDPTVTRDPELRPSIFDGQNVPRKPPRVTIDPSEASPIAQPLILRFAASAAGTVFFIVVVLLCAIILAINVADFIYAGDFGTNAIKTLSGAIVAIVGLVSACGSLVIQVKTLAKRVGPSTTKPNRHRR